MNITDVVENNLCVSCGICAGVCPKRCISSEYRDGRYLPTVDEKSCVDCGLCRKVCPGKASDYPKLYELSGAPVPKNFMLGNWKRCLAVQTNYEELLKLSTSGGAVTMLVLALLRNKIFDAAFLVDTYAHDEEIFSAPYTTDSDFTSTPKSRYLTVNHRRAVEYMLKNPDAKIIFVGTSCFMQGLLNVIGQFKLRRENYLLFGLFCDKTMHYGVWEYFKQICGEKNLRRLFFRSKEQSGWPGNVELDTEQQKYFLPRQTRMHVKDFFCLERCRYCLDKLNQFADISFGDDYTRIDLPAPMERDKGASNVILRTNRGVEVFERFADCFYVHEISARDIVKAHGLNVRKQNIVFGEYKSAQVGYPINVVPAKISFDATDSTEHQNTYRTLLGKQQLGREKNFPAVAADVAAKIFKPVKELRK
ncbi:MAG: Coenzyme F420 hydrogenase/dehydrogenase, beta subunit C-terminal domain [Quinella sp. 1Q7]|nr:Coenzyme F420 hydrogenase/dehydrogenase, beta subunit C-terminal domain [Quinella sp. 1Q7]